VFANQIMHFRPFFPLPLMTAMPGITPYALKLLKLLQQT
jgi:hypothetical protein